MPGRVRLVSCRRARCEGVIAEDRCLELLSALREVPLRRVRPRRDGCRRPTTRARASCVAWRCSNTLSTAAAGMDP